MTANSAFTTPLPAMLLAVSLVVGLAACNYMDAPPPRMVSVAGQGEVEAEPDRAWVTLGIEARKPKLPEARAEVNSKVDAVLKLTGELNIDPKYVRSTRVTIQPQYSYDNSGRERSLLGYFVSRQIEVDLRDLELLGQLLERATDLGVNQMGEPRLDSSKREELQRAALGKAVADARLNAEALARAAGVRVGAVRNMSASANTVAPPMPLSRMVAMRAEGNAAESYQRGQMNFTAAVQIEYDLAVDAGR